MSVGRVFRGRDAWTEAEQASALVAEQAVWADSSRRLDDVERMLARRP